MNRIVSIVCAGLALVSFADDERGENLIKNSEFNEAIAKPWSMVAGVVRRETEALSGDWMLSALGKNYFIINYMDDPDLKWEAGEQFTIVIDARSRGAGANLAIIHRYTKPDGGIGEGTYRRLDLTGDWHEYYVPVTATKGGKPRGFSFFKIDTGAHDTGVEIRSFKMYRGKISSLDFRSIGRAGRSSIAKGTEIPVAANRFGVAAKPLRVLTFVKDVRHLREAMHIFSGTGATAHYAVAASKDSDTFSTDDDPKEILKRLKTGGYDLYVFGRGVAPNIGPEVFKLVEANVKKGAAAFFAPAKEFGAFKGIAEAKDGKYGAGRVTRQPWRQKIDGEYPNAGRAFTTYPNGLANRLGFEAFPYEEVIFAELANEMWAAAFGADAVPADAKTVRKQVAYAGRTETLEWKRSADGRAYSFAHSSEPLAGPSIGAFTDTGREVEVVISNATMTAELKWTFKDFSGRLFGSGTAKGPVARIAVPREKLYTSYGLLELTLVDGVPLRSDGVLAVGDGRGGDGGDAVATQGGGRKVVDRRNEAVIEEDNDRLRMIADYGTGIWPMAGCYTYQDAKDMFVQLRDAGFNYSFMPHAWGTVYSTGLGATSGYVIGGEYFSGGPTAKDNIRSPVFNTPEARQRIREKALKWAKGNRKWGGMYGSFSDEAALGPNGMEVDAHPENLKVYRQWMERKYGTIAEYNRRHRSNRASFADLNQTLLKDARAAGNAAEFIEWRNFNVDRWVEVIREVGDAIKEVDPKVLYSLDNSFGEMPLSGNDYWKLLTQTGLDYSKEYSCCTSFGRSPLQEFDALYRSWRPDMRMWGWTGYGFTSLRERALPWMTALHRQGGFHWFAATYPGINLLDLVTCAKTLDATECTKSLEDSRMLLGLGKTLTDWKWAKNDIAIYYSHDSNILTYFLGTETLMNELRGGTPYGNFMNSRRGLMTLLESTFYQYEFIAQEQVEKGFLDGGDWSVYRAGKVIEGQPPFRVLFMPRILAMSDKEVAAVKAFLKRGGKVVCDELPGAYDELGVKRDVIPFTDSEMLVTGKNFDDLDPAQRAWAVSFLKSAGATATIESPTVVKNLEREGMHYQNGGADLYGVVRKPFHSAITVTPDENAEELRFAKRGHVYDVRAQKYLGVTDHVTTKVPYAEAQLFAMLPAKLTGVKISGPAEAARGEAIVQDLRLETKDARPAYVVHVDIVPPSGKCPFHFQRNLATKDGAAKLTFPLALNDETGLWKIRVTEPLTGVVAERTVAVR